MNAVQKLLRRGPRKSAPRLGSSSAPANGAVPIARASGAIVVAVATPQEKVLQAALGWTEEQARRALFAAEHDPAPDGRIVDRWGDLSEMTDAAAADTLARLDAEDEAAGVEPWPS